MADCTELAEGWELFLMKADEVIFRAIRPLAYRIFFNSSNEVMVKVGWGCSGFKSFLLML